MNDILELEKSERKFLANFMVDILALESIGGDNASNFIKCFLIFLSLPENKEKNDIVETKLTVQLKKHIRAIVIRFKNNKIFFFLILFFRFPIEFDLIRTEWSIRDKSVLDQFLLICHIELHEIGELSFKKSCKKRTSSCGSPSTLQEDISLISDVQMNDYKRLTVKNVLFFNKIFFF